jgi:hypothetical protein
MNYAEDEFESSLGIKRVREKREIRCNDKQ